MNSQHHLFQFKITLIGSRPPIWRRILVPSDFTFGEFSQAIIDSMGWLDYHTHDFKLRNPINWRRCTISMHFYSKHYEENEIIKDYFSFQNINAIFTYDYGDWWEHLIEFEGIFIPEQGKKYPICLEGCRRCPLEDSGGVSGYENVLEILSDPYHEEFEQTIDWIPDDFNSEYFSAGDIAFDDLIVQQY
ncbi:unnamed protein product [Blepharisma stoltei]|uniref:Plasmid pRiA4b Orf3-like domain-containing protein n=1 Tax=Blepharisma stoltei TaxID=1481888 RepID=A0AAU9K935_9CILI|nr:unnamed protein product [Blepharisma stoltei]